MLYHYYMYTLKFKYLEREKNLNIKKLFFFGVLSQKNIGFRPRTGNKLNNKID